jgi:hypothetical protein
MTAIALPLELDTTISTYSKINLAKIPSYVTSLRPNGNSPFEVLFNIYKRRELIVRELLSDSVSYREDNIALKFQQLSAEVEEDCMFVSSPSQIIIHPSYQKIIGMGKKAVPFLIRKLNDSPTFWFWALQAIVDINPVPKSDKGNIAEMVNRWEKWFHDNYNEYC